MVILRIDPGDSETRTKRLESLDRQILALYPLTEWEKALFWDTVQGGSRHEDRPTWTDEPWPLHGVVEAIRVANEKGPATIRIRVPAFRRGAQIYDGPIPPDMPGWAMVEGIEFQAEIPWSDAEACHFDPFKVQQFRPLPFAHEARQKKGRARTRRGK